MGIINKRPILFEKSNHNIWTDPYIQQQILKKHLDFQSDEAIWGIERSGFFNDRGKWVKGFENQRV